MTALLLSIFASSLIFVIFKTFEKFKINSLQAIVFNYITAASCGFLLSETTLDFSALPQHGWFFPALGLGAIFILVFNLMALTTRRSGLAVVSVATKMSVVIPVVFGLLYYGESLHFWKAVGIILALVAVYFVSIKSQGGLIAKTGSLLPFLVFFGSGIIDAGIKFLEQQFVAEGDVPLFSAVAFSAAAGVGLLGLLGLIVFGKFKFEPKNVIGGLALGIPNYFSIYFLIVALRSGFLESSGIFTVNNVAIVLFSTLLGLVLFKEKLLPKNWFGIVLAIISLFLVTMGKQ